MLRHYQQTADCPSSGHEHTQRAVLWDPVKKDHDYHNHNYQSIYKFKEVSEPNPVMQQWIFSYSQQMKMGGLSSSSLSHV